MSAGPLEGHVDHECIVWPSTVDEGGPLPMTLECLTCAVVLLTIEGEDA